MCAVGLLESAGVCSRRMVCIVSEVHINLPNSSLACCFANWNWDHEERSHRLTLAWPHVLFSLSGSFISSSLSLCVGQQSIFWILFVLFLSWIVCVVALHKKKNLQSSGVPLLLILLQLLPHPLLFSGTHGISLFVRAAVPVTDAACTSHSSTWWPRFRCFWRQREEPFWLRTQELFQLASTLLLLLYGKAKELRTFKDQKREEGSKKKPSLSLCTFSVNSQTYFLLHHTHLSLSLPPQFDAQ